MLDPIIGSAVVSGLGSLFGGFGSAGANLKAQKEANKGNMQLAEYQYAKNLEMWNKQNEYNTPYNQRMRAEAAGLNPNLLYGHGSLSNTAAPAPSYQAPTLQAYTNMPNIVGDAINSFNATRAASADIAKKRAEAVKATSEAQGQEVANEVNREFLRDDKKFEVGLKELKYNYDKELSKYNKLLARAESDKKTYEVTQLREIINNIKSQRKLIDAQTTNEQLKVPILQQEYFEVPARRDYYESMSLLNRARVGTELSQTHLNENNALFTGIKAMREDLRYETDDIRLANEIWLMGLTRSKELQELQYLRQRNQISDAQYQNYVLDAALKSYEKQFNEEISDYRLLRWLQGFLKDIKL